MGKKHKSENTFKFRTFSERLGDVQIDVVRRTTCLSAVPEDAETFFGQALRKWSDVNVTQHFSSFRDEIRDQVQSLTQLIYHKENVLNIVQKHLQVDPSMATAALVDLVVQLARDLQQDFYPYFPQFFKLIVTHIMKPGQTVEILEAAFTSLSFLFKILWREMVVDMNHVLEVYAPLFTLKKREHIKKFAAESIAFVIRKVKDRDRLFGQMFERLRTHPNEIQGYGLILFEMMKGVKNQLHSCTELTLPLVLSKLAPEEDSTLKALEITYTSLLEHGDVAQVQILWICTLNRIDAIIKASQENTKLLTSLLKLLLVLVGHEKGRTLKEHERIAKLVNSILKLPFDIACHATLMDLIVVLFENSLLESRLVHGIITEVFKGDLELDFVFDFIDRIFSVPCFEQSVLLPFLTFCHQCIKKDSEMDDGLLLILTKLILDKCPLPDSSDADQRQYILDFTMKVRGRKSVQWIGSKLMDILSGYETTPVSKLMCALVCLPHLRPFPEQCRSKISEILKKFIRRFDPDEFGSSTLIYLCMLALDHVTDRQISHEIPIETVVDLLKKKNDDLDLLRTVDLYTSRLSVASNTASVKDLNHTRGIEMMSILKPNLTFGFKTIRLLTVKILSKFEFRLSSIENRDLEQLSVFKICLQAEKVPLTVTDFRNKQFHLSKLEYQHVQRQLPEGGEAADVPLRYLIGCMYNNFSLLWLPVRKMIETHAHGMLRDQFWTVYAEHLEYLAEMNEGSTPVSKSFFPIVSALDTLFSETVTNQLTLNDKPDYGIVRYHLWKSMQHFSPLCEAKSKTICPLLFRFLENEYYIHDMNAAPTQDLRKNQSSKIDLDDTADDAEEDEMDDDTIDTTKKVSKTGKTRIPITKYLIAHLELFTKFKSPKSLTMESQLLDLYHRLLSHRYQNVQKVALDCLMTYKYKYLIPYRENLDKILDDSQFKDEIVRFSLSEENSVIEADHREQLIPILMKLLYGRMISKTGKETTGKQNATLRKTLVLRFLGGCRQDELRVFMDLVFGAFKQYCSEDLSVKLSEVLQSVDMSRVIPVRQQQSALHTLDVVFSNLGNSIDTYLSDLLHIITCVTAVCLHILDSRDELLPQVVNSLKTLRTLGLTRIMQFFSSFENYNFKESEIDALFNGVVWPLVKKLPNEGIYSPTQILKIIHIWSANEKFLHLLSRSMDDGQSVLSLVFALLLSKSAHSSVTSLIMDIVENLLNSGEEDVDVAKGKRGVVSEISGPGIEILIPHVQSLVTYLHGVVKSMTSRGTKKFSLPVKDIRILAKLSSHVNDAKLCGNIVDLLIPFLARSAAKDEKMEIDILESVKHLLEKTDDPADFLWSLSKLFSSISGRLSRRALCDVITSVANRVPERQTLADIVSKLNAWDRRRVDEVDYESRLDAYSAINDFVRDMTEVDVIYLNFVIHNASYYLRTSDDMSLRDSASHCLQILVERLGELTLKPDTYQRLVDGALLPQVRSGLKISNETPRNEFIKILVLCVKAFPQNKVIAPLKNLMNDEDVEVDVFMNITHIQLHRRGRAMKKLIHLLPTAEIKTECLTLYLLPMVSHFLSDAYVKHPAIIDAAVECVGAISKLLPWSKYSQCLNGYLSQLTKSMSMQKIMVKVIVAVLDAFHFDIGSEEVSDSSKPEQKSTEDNESAMETVEEDAEVVDEIEETPKEKLSSEEAKRIRSDLLSVVVPQLKQSLAKKAKSDDEHKLAKSKYAEDEEILRVPIALALVKLLQQFPISILKTHLPGLLLKVCEFLRSRAKDIRDTARDTLIKILSSLGHTYFPFILAELQGALKRGYQVHVLVYTVVALLNSMKPVLKTEMLDSSIPIIVDILNQELFGDLAAEKEISEITSKFHEAKAIKGYDGYEILATYVGKGMIGKLLVPLKEILTSTNSHKTNKKIEEVLKRISVGLIENKDLDVEVLMIFIHGLVNDTLPLLKTQKEVAKVELKPGQQPPSALLLEKATPRGGYKPRVDKKTNSNILVEFGLQLLQNLLKRSRLTVTDQKHKQLLDPFVSVLSEALDSKHVRVISWAMRCLSWALGAELPSVRKHVADITKKLFVLLKDYAAAGAAKGDNQELVMACFKALTVIVRDVTYYEVSADQVRVLLLYVEEDIHDNTRQATAFTLLRAILIRQIMIPEMTEVMWKICRLSVTSDSPQIRQKCRQVILKFLLDYPLGKKVRLYLEFFIAQLTYEMEPGRESVLEMIASLFMNFPNSMVEAYCLLFFMPLSTRLINDESTRCRKLVSLALKSLLGRVSIAKRDEVVKMLITWSGDSKPLHQQLAMILLGLLAEVENDKFERRLNTVLPIVRDRIEPHRFSEDVDADTKSGLDKVLYSSLNCLVKILTQCPSLIRNRALSKVVNDIWLAVKSHLLYPHQWVRLVSSQVIGLLFAAWTPAEVTKYNKQRKDEFFGEDAEVKLRSLTLDLLKMFKDVTDIETGEQAVKDLVFVAKCARIFQANSGKTEEDITEEEKPKNLRLDWLIRKMCREATFEATQNVKSTLKRKCVYKWLAAVSADIGSELPKFLRFILPPLVRDTGDKIPNLDESLKTLAEEVLDFIKTTAGVEDFLKCYTEIQKSSVDRVEKRKREKAIQAVANPEISSRKRIKKNLQKRDAKKRKISSMRPTRGVKKRKLNDVVIAD